MRMSSWVRGGGDSFGVGPGDVVVEESFYDLDNGVDFFGGVILVSFVFDGDVPEPGTGKGCVAVYGLALESVH